MSVQDLVVTPIFLFIIFTIAWVMRSQMTNRATAKWFLPALGIKCFGAIALGLVYQFYYGGGDTYNYYTWGGSWIWEAFLDDPVLAFKIIFGDSSRYDPEIYQYTSHMIFYGTSGAGFVSRLAGFFGLFTFNTYSTIAILFGVLSFMGQWWFYINISKLYPSLSNKFALAIFMLPSVVIWGSGLLKDTLILGGVCAVMGSLIQMLEFRKVNPINVLILLLGTWIIYEVKIYVLLCLAPGLLVYVYLKFKNSIRSWALRIMLIPVLLALAIFSAYTGIRLIPQDESKYSLERISRTATDTARWHEHVSEKFEGSGYTLGEGYDYSNQGLVAKILPAINVTLFRPYPWEINSAFMLLSSMESMFFLGFTFLVMINIGPIRMGSLTLKNPLVFGSLIFVLAFAFAVGAVTYNFGALVRYKIPILPFFLILLNIVYQNKSSNH